VDCRALPRLPTPYASKPYALVHSDFEEILVIDADNTPIRNPEYLFDSEPYEETGAVFWPDFEWAPSNEAWKQLADLDSPLKCRQQESGQILIHKKRCEAALAKTLDYNRRYEDIRPYLWGAGGDKDTFQLAWHATRSPFHMIPFYPGSAGKLMDGNYQSNTMIQHDHKGTPLFMHKNALKWHLLREECRSWEQCIFAKDPSGADITYTISGDSVGHTHELLPKENTYSLPAEKVIANLEDDCLDWIAKLRKKSWYRWAVYRFYLRDYLSRLFRTS
jgi:alpha 1,2-mannosyltransferase